jgi:hypothetical protein
MGSKQTSRLATLHQTTPGRATLFLLRLKRHKYNLYFVDESVPVYSLETPTYKCNQNVTRMGTP